MPKKIKPPLGCEACPNLDCKYEGLGFRGVDILRHLGADMCEDTAKLIVVSPVGLEKSDNHRNTVWVPPVSCINGVTNAKTLKNCREEVVNPVLDMFPNMPVLCRGTDAVKAIFGANVGSGLLGKVRMYRGHRVYCTYDLNDSEITSRQRHHEKVMRESALAAMPEIDWKLVNYPFHPSEWDKLLQQPRWYVDLECTGLELPWLGSAIACVGLATDLDDTVYIFPIEHETADSMMEQVQFYFERYKGEIVGHNIKYDLHFLQYFNMLNPEATFYDTCVESRCDTLIRKGTNGLKWLAKESFGLPGYEAEAHTLWDQGTNCHEMDINILGEYCSFDVLITKDLYKTGVKNAEK